MQRCARNPPSDGVPADPTGRRLRTRVAKRLEVRGKHSSSSLAYFPKHRPDIRQPPVRLAPMKIVRDDMILEQVLFQVFLDARLQEPSETVP